MRCRSMYSSTAVARVRVLYGGEYVCYLERRTRTGRRELGTTPAHPRAARRRGDGYLRMGCAERTYLHFASHMCDARGRRRRQGLSSEGVLDEYCGTELYLEISDIISTCMSSLSCWYLDAMPPSWARICLYSHRTFCIFEFDRIRWFPDARTEIHLKF